MPSSRPPVHHGGCQFARIVRARTGHKNSAGRHAFFLPNHHPPPLFSFLFPLCPPPPPRSFLMTTSTPSSPLLHDNPIPSSSSVQPLPLVAPSLSSMPSASLPASSSSRPHALPAPPASKFKSAKISAVSKPAHARDAPEIEEPQSVDLEYLTFVKKMPRWWGRSLEKSEENIWFTTIIATTSPASPSIVLLTRLPMPDLSSLRHLSQSIHAEACPRKLTLTKGQQLQIHAHTVDVMAYCSTRARSDVFQPLSVTPYLFCPFLENADRQRNQSPGIQWVLLDRNPENLSPYLKTSYRSLPRVVAYINQVLLLTEFRPLFPRCNFGPDFDLLTSFAPIEVDPIANFEVAELEGDGIMGITATLTTFLNPDDPEVGALTVADIVNNKEIAKLSCALDLPAYILDLKDFSIDKWVNRWKERFAVNESNTVTMPAKHPADLAEALIGYAHKEGGCAGTFRVCKALGVRLPPRIATWAALQSQILQRPHAPSIDRLEPRAPLASPSAKPSCLRPGDIDADYALSLVEDFLGRHLQNPAAFRRATNLRIPAQVSAVTAEELGSALLRYHAVTYLTAMWGHQFGPGDLTRMVNAIVSTEATAALGIHSRIFLVLTRQVDAIEWDGIHRYAGRMEKAMMEEAAEARRANRGPGQHWRHTLAPEIVAAVVGRLFFSLLVSEEFDVGRVFFRRLCVPFFLRYGKDEAAILQHEDRLTNCLKRCCRQFKILVVRKPATHNLPEIPGQVWVIVKYHHITLGTAYGPTPHIAARDSCRDAWESLKRMDWVAICDCSAVVIQGGPKLIQIGTKRVAPCKG
ncbi:hypothetical protein BOTBODRAFT_587459 [Botryobasidium botryosum FD-172 SS1]|uniref:Uncharacterized protein n=1 Tax=Botryobasidium botryosum (strain FD-172 SS1) TaxID=930990 RepID=A0A067LZZ9_BOTB1|nr:hypothetical protein BOTBODRAFT_587459 [Botryobasidium botryosum FD-172 SS1]